MGRWEKTPLGMKGAVPAKPPGAFAPRQHLVFLMTYMVLSVFPIIDAQTAASVGVTLAHWL